MAVGTGNRVVYDLEADIAHFGAVSVSGPAVLWELSPINTDDLGEGGCQDVALSAAVELDGSVDWLMRCDRVDFPTAAVAHRHVHPGPGIRRLLFGELAVTTSGITTTHQKGDPWFEIGPDPVYAESSATQESAFVRVMLLPAEWARRRTIRYLDAFEERPARQRVKVYLEEPLV